MFKILEFYLWLKKFALEKHKDFNDIKETYDRGIMVAGFVKNS